MGQFLNPLLSQLTSQRVSINLCNENEIINGKYVWTDGNEYTDATYMCSGYIPVTPAFTYKTGIFSAAGVLSTNAPTFITYFNSSKVKISGFSPASGVRTFIPPANTAYVRISWYKSSGTLLMVVKAALFKGSAVNSSIKQPTIEDYAYIPYNTNIAIPNPLQGKYLIDFGDSIQRGDGTSGLGLGYLIAKNNSMAFTQYSAGGLRVADCTAYQLTYDRVYITGKRYFSYASETYTELIENTDWTAEDAISGDIYQINNMKIYLNTAIAASISPDYVLLDGGINDIGGTITLGDISTGYTAELDTATFTGALEYTFKTIRATWPASKILYVRVHNMNSRDAALQVTYGERAIAVCKKWSIPYVDLYSDGQLNTNIDAMKTAYTSSADGTHPNAAGYSLFYVPLVEAKLKTL